MFIRHKSDKKDLFKFWISFIFILFNKLLAFATLQQKTKTFPHLRHQNVLYLGFYRVFACMYFFYNLSVGLNRLKRDSDIVFLNISPFKICIRKKNLVDLISRVLFLLRFSKVFSNLLWNIYNNRNIIDMFLFLFICHF